jgi:hypothetical protein
LEPYLLLELQGAHRGDGLKVVVKARDAHAKLLGNVLNAKRLVERSTEPSDSPGDAVGVVALERNVTESVALLTFEEPVDDFPRDQGQEKGRFGRSVQEPDEPHHRVQQACVQRADVDGPYAGMASCRDVTGLDHD